MHPRWVVQVLNKEHRRGDFSCGVADVDLYLRQFARQNDEKGLGKTYILSPTEDLTCVAGYYTLSAGSVAAAAVPPAIQKRLPGYPVPVLLLARLARDNTFKGQSLGEVLLLDALEKALVVADVAGTCAVQVDAIDDRAVAFYAKYGFVAMVDSPRTLFLSMKVVRTLFKR